MDFSIANEFQLIWTKASHFANMDQLWIDWPQRDVDGLTKFYILTQLSYWIQQVISVNIEARRKDYWLNVVHHFITITLILVSYVYHHTRVGGLILVMMDAIEILFPVRSSRYHLAIMLTLVVCQMPQISGLYYSL